MTERPRSSDCTCSTRLAEERGAGSCRFIDAGGCQSYCPNNRRYVRYADNSRGDESLVTVAVPYYERSLDFEALWREFPPAGEYREKVHFLSRDELRAIQERRFLAQI